MSQSLEMKLLYAQSLDLIKLYYAEIPKNKIIPLKYYLFPKTWLDNYKSKFNYSDVSQQINLSQFIDFNSYKEKILENKKYNTNLENELNLIESKKESGAISNHQVIYPKNFTLVKQEIYKNLNNNYLYDIIIGEKNIFILDNNSNRNVFICSLEFSEYSEDITDFVVNVDAVLIFNDNKKKKEKKNLFNYISENKGIKNYYKIGKIDLNKKGEQIVYDKEGEEIGIFYKIKNDNENMETPQSFNEDYVNGNKGNRNNIILFETKVVEKLNINNKEKINNNYHPMNEAMNAEDNFLKEKRLEQRNQGMRRNSKCITIYGDIYYYFTRKEYKNNTFISQYNVENNNYFNNNINNY